MQERCFYVITDQFYIDFPDPYLKENKAEHRPHYFALKDSATSLIWMIPMSSRAEKYERIIQDRLQKGKPCDTLHVCTLDNGIKNAFLIQDMFPVTEAYIAHEYTINGNPLILTSEKEAAIVHQKALRTINMIHRGIKFTPTQPNVLPIEKALLGK